MVTTIDSGCFYRGSRRSLRLRHRILLRWHAERARWISRSFLCSFGGSNVRVDKSLGTFCIKINRTAGHIEADS